MSELQKDYTNPALADDHARPIPEREPIDTMLTKMRAIRAEAQVREFVDMRFAQAYAASLNNRKVGPLANIKHRAGGEVAAVAIAEPWAIAERVRKFIKRDRGNGSVH